MAENDVLMKVRELQMEVNDVTTRLARTENEFTTYRNESHEKQRELESELQMTKDRLQEVISILRLIGKHIRKYWVWSNIYIIFNI